RQGKSGRTNCKAHINLIHIGGGKWRISLIDAEHNHERHVPEGITVQCPPTLAQRSALSSLAFRSSTRLSGPGWDFAVRLDGNVVVAFWWQSPEQAQITRRYTDILINDNSYNRNCHGSGSGYKSARSHNSWYAFQKKEDTEMFVWILGNHLRAAGDVHPEIFISDRAGALIAAVAVILCFTFHIYCLSHLIENLDRNLSRTLGPEWQNFLRDFWSCYRAVSPENFETHELYQCRDRWAWAWISLRFTAGIRTNGRVEVENRITKHISGPGKNLFQVFTALNERTKDQHKAELLKVREHPGELERASKPILDMLRDHGGIYAVQTSFKQMQLEPYYNASALQLPTGVRNWVRYHLDFHLLLG
ncbi:hypothetical protein B0H13DRAFT_1639881, partial [Mycena leptocephala]